MKEILHCIAQEIYDRKGMNIIALDIHRVSHAADFVLIAEGFVHQHVRSIAEGLIALLRKKGMTICHVEGLQNGDWVVLDCFSLVIHIFTPFLRHYYQIEKLWHLGEIVDLGIKTDSITKE